MKIVRRLYYFTFENIRKYQNSSILSYDDMISYDHMFLSLLIMTYQSTNGLQKIIFLQHIRLTHNQTNMA